MTSLLKKIFQNHTYLKTGTLIEPPFTPAYGSERSGYFFKLLTEEGRRRNFIFDYKGELPEKGDKIEYTTLFGIFILEFRKVE